MCACAYVLYINAYVCIYAHMLEYFIWLCNNFDDDNEDDYDDDNDDHDHDMVTYFNVS